MHLQELLLKQKSKALNKLKIQSNTQTHAQTHTHAHKYVLSEKRDEEADDDLLLLEELVASINKLLPPADSSAVVIEIPTTSSASPPPPSSSPSVPPSSHSCPNNSTIAHIIDTLRNINELQAELTLKHKQSLEAQSASALEEDEFIKAQSRRQEEAAMRCAYIYE